MVTVEVWCVPSATHLPHTHRHQMFVAVFFFFLFDSFVMAWTVTSLWCNLAEMLRILGAQERGQYGCPGRWVAARSVPPDFVME